MKIALSDLHGCFEGVVPSKMATCSKDGTPNASYLSHVYHVDDRHVAISFQFFNRTRANLMENPYAVLQVRHPSNLQPYNLKVKYLRSEENGPLFEKMAVKLDIIAAYEGMGAKFQLKAADIYEVLEIQKVEGKTNYFPTQECPNENLKDLELMRVLSDKLAEARSMEDLLDLSLQLANKYLGWKHMILLLSDQKSGSLLTHASLGYQRQGVGSEVGLGEGLIGVCAEHQRLLQVGAIQEGLRYAKAVKKTSGQEQNRIPLPGLPKPASQVAAPIRAHGRFWGVFAVESETQTYWAHRETLFLSTLSNLLGLGLNSFAGKDEVMKLVDSKTGGQKEAGKLLRFRFVAGDDLIFLNDQYLIRNIPARILRYLLQVAQTTGRTEFSNIELRSEKSLMLPEFKDNLEARLILLRKRLDEQSLGVRLVSTGRGKFKIEIAGSFSMEEA